MTWGNFSVLFIQKDVLCTFGQADLQMGIFHPGESGYPLLVVWEYSHTPTGSQRSQLHLGTEYQTQDVLHPLKRKRKDFQPIAILSQLAGVLNWECMLTDCRAVLASASLSSPLTQSRWTLLAICCNISSLKKQRWKVILLVFTCLKSKCLTLPPPQKNSSCHTVRSPGSIGNVVIEKHWAVNL